MVTFPPLCPSAGWIAKYLSLRGEGRSHREAVKDVNKALHVAREFSRFSIEDNNGNPLMLSLAVEGGSRQLRNVKTITEVNLSEHGDWRRIHSGAIEACLGRKPFFRELADPLLRVINNKELKTLRAYNTAIFEVIITFLMGNIDFSDLGEFGQRKVVQERGKEISAGINPEWSVVQVLANHGREGLLGLLSLETHQVESPDSV